MKFIKKKILCQSVRGICLALASITLMITMGAITPAYPHDRYDEGEHDRRWERDRRWDHERYERDQRMEWREHERNARRWRHKHVYRDEEPEFIYVEPPVHFLPPPPPPPPGINIIIPLRFR